MTGNRPALRHNKQAAKRDSLEQVYWRKRMPEYQNVSVLREENNLQKIYIALGVVNILELVLEMQYITWEA